MIIHQYWHDEDAPLPVWREYMRFFYDTILWTPDTVPDHLAALIKEIGPCVRQEDEKRHIANLVRYWVLHEFGGIWLDVDVLPIDDLYTYPMPFVAAHGDTACSCIMGFPEGHPILRSAIDRVLGLPYDEDARCVNVSGDGLLNDLLTDEVQRHQLPFDAVGHPIKDANLWAIHLYNTSGGDRCR